MDDKDVEHFSALYDTFLSDGDAEAWQQYRAQIPAWQQVALGHLEERLRAEFHTRKAFERRSNLTSLLAQTPPFSLSDADRRVTKSRQGQRRRYTQLQYFVSQNAGKKAIGVHPFFASLRRILEYQSSGSLDRCCQWILDDAVLMETGGDGWTERVVWILKGVLLFEEEEEQGGSDPSIAGEVATSSSSFRRWTVSPTLSDPECASLARVIPAHVLPKRGRGSSPIRHGNDDEESAREIELPTGKVCLSDTFRDEDHRGNILARLWAWLVSQWF